KAARTSSMRACELGIPRVWLPDIEPEASNTIMASSVQGDGFFSSLLLEPLPTVIVSNAMIEKEKIQQMTLLLQARLRAICVNLPLNVPEFTAGTCQAVNFPVAAGELWGETGVSLCPWFELYSGLRGTRGTR